MHILAYTSLVNLLLLAHIYTCSVCGIECKFFDWHVQSYVYFELDDTFSLGENCV